METAHTPTQYPSTNRRICTCGLAGPKQFLVTCSVVTPLATKQLQTRARGGRWLILFLVCAALLVFSASLPAGSDCLPLGPSSTTTILG